MLALEWGHLPGIRGLPLPDCGIGRHPDWAMA